MNESSTPQRRSKLFVDARLQGGLVKRILLHWLIFVAVGTAIAAVLRLWTHPTVPFREQAGEIFASTGPFLVTMLALLPVFVVDTIKLTNRFAGPFVRFRRHVRAVVEGRDPGPIKFRKGDYWQETEADLNAILREIEQLRREVRAATAGHENEQDESPFTDRFASTGTAPSPNRKPERGDA